MDEVPGDAARYRKGLAVRRSVLGDRHVDRAEIAATDFDQPFQELITEAAWGTVWARPGFTKRERSIVTLALLAALGHDEEIAMHVRATANTGASRDDICEAFLHVAIYAGVPAANRAFKIAKEVFSEMDGSQNAR
ncbi:MULTISPECIES: 4-carboxymuconolactone decarboxylase [unclassified Mesorhizobium]|jgi:4-carboxymuconolactone decarboxylase|uniref:4-carboxymuconolactone decarboxylase n=1 Tax=unclassified Mesorhizobium TaxID=325217 RepID=UPI000FCA9F25|nr:MULTISPECIES: 4-carboxymuconolactone decarboxylase [unclassified Mesorhizobium]RUU11646.1 4-carboxymuconolactone decarboxylase [Mesorhizobium sp. M7A.T.Ca.TU.009.01.3.2]RUU67167.1 4-carboxymuconolactone decarboxylase [Mesorhizobium sp. M7A.T.Ca.TU.009.01.1.1]RUU95240.1 4-carboxymuconolactone decarboxylase [Mesorhizobium sp. M7A.T.Ca.TU.009.01.3.1]RUV51717.1 4-carboxymuconolactone decarboxylase [Mesorhizobium sp. M7A.F.Ca.MR.228.00.0.0]AZV23295.1 4-carboxymuconolactone decarboxylase [Mesorhi